MKKLKFFFENSLKTLKRCRFYDRHVFACSYSRDRTSNIDNNNLVGRPTNG